MGSNQHRVEVEIFGSTYTLRSDEDPEYTNQLARYVDAKMRSITQKTDTVSTGKIAILAALYIADEFFKSKETASQKIERLVRKIDRHLESLSQGK